MHVSDFFDIGMAVINKFGNNTIAKNWLEELEIEQNDLIIIEVSYKWFYQILTYWIEFIQKSWTKLKTFWRTKRNIICQILEQGDWEIARKVKIAGKQVIVIRLYKKIEARNNILSTTI